MRSYAATTPASAACSRIPPRGCMSWRTRRFGAFRRPWACADRLCDRGVDLLEHCLHLGFRKMEARRLEQIDEPGGEPGLGVHRMECATDVRGDHLVIGVEAHPTAVCLRPVDDEGPSGDIEDELLDPVQDRIEGDLAGRTERLPDLAHDLVRTVMNEHGGARIALAHLHGREHVTR